MSLEKSLLMADSHSQNSHEHLNQSLHGQIHHPNGHEHLFLTAHGCLHHRIAFFKSLEWALG